MNPNLPLMPSLQGMHDILLPPPVPFWPATPAWAVLGVVALAAALWLAGRSLRHWRRNAYRRQARRTLEGAAGRGDLAALPSLVKRAALAAFPRQQVADLSGADWAAWLRRTAPRAGLTAEESLALAQFSYLRPAGAAPLALAAARKWLAQHDRAA
jgi:hypothetical protein